MRGGQPLFSVATMASCPAMEARVSPSASSSSSSSSSPSSLAPRNAPSRSSCPICLGSVSGEAFLDPCFHSFCFHCILQWTEIVSAHPSLEGETYLECPLCKKRSSCIVHDVAQGTFQRFYPFGNPHSSATNRFSLSRSHYRRLYVYQHKLHEAMAYAICQSLQTSEKLNKNRRNDQFPPLRNRNLVLQWLQRELQSLLREEDVNLITQHVIGVLEYFVGKKEWRSWKASMAETVRPFIVDHADAFCDELENFLFTGLNMESYDEIVKQVVETHVHRHTEAVDVEEETLRPS